MGKEEPINHSEYGTFHDMCPEGLEISPQSYELLESKFQNNASLGYDDVTLKEVYSEIKPGRQELFTFVTKHYGVNNSGLISAAMDSVTDKNLALAMARNGGLGVLHKNLQPKEQASQVDWVRQKVNYGGMVDEPFAFNLRQTYLDIQEKMREYDLVNESVSAMEDWERWNFTSFPIVNDDGRLVGLITRKELDFEIGDNPEENPRLEDIMLRMDEGEVVYQEGPLKSEDAYEYMKEKRTRKLPLIDKEGKLDGMYIWKDIKKDRRRWKENKITLDEDNHHLVAAAISSSEEDKERIEQLHQKGCKILVMDSSHGSNAGQVERIKWIRNNYGDDFDIVAGNVSSYQAARGLLERTSDFDALKVGISPGGTCTTKQMSGFGNLQISAPYEAHRAIKELLPKEKHMPLILDGGIKLPKHYMRGRASGAHAGMLGSLLGMTYQSPFTRKEDGQWVTTIRGMGSKNAMKESKGSRERYFEQEDSHGEGKVTQEQHEKNVPEGVERTVKVKGSLEEVINAFKGGSQISMGHANAGNIREFQKNAVMSRVPREEDDEGADVFDIID